MCFLEATAFSIFVKLIISSGSTAVLKVTIFSRWFLRIKLRVDWDMVASRSSGFGDKSITLVVWGSRCLAAGLALTALITEIRSSAAIFGLIGSRLTQAAPW